MIPSMHCLACRDSHGKRTAGGGGVGKPGGREREREIIRRRQEGAFHLSHPSLLLHCTIFENIEVSTQVDSKTLHLRLELVVVLSRTTSLFDFMKRHILVVFS
jgi:hypothetical protein